MKEEERGDGKPQAAAKFVQFLKTKSVEQDNEAHEKFLNWLKNPKTKSMVKE